MSAGVILAGRWAGPGCGQLRLCVSVPSATTPGTRDVVGSLHVARRDLAGLSRALVTVPAPSTPRRSGV